MAEKKMAKGRSGGQASWASIDQGAPSALRVTWIGWLYAELQINRTLFQLLPSPLSLGDAIIRRVT